MAKNSYQDYLHGNLNPHSTDQVSPAQNLAQPRRDSAQDGQRGRTRESGRRDHTRRKRDREQPRRDRRTGDRRDRDRRDRKRKREHKRRDRRSDGRERERKRRKHRRDSREGRGSRERRGDRERRGVEMGIERDVVRDVEMGEERGEERNEDRIQERSRDNKNRQERKQREFSSERNANKNEIEQSLRDQCNSDPQEKEDKKSPKQTPEPLKKSTPIKPTNPDPKPLKIPSPIPSLPDPSNSPKPIPTAPKTSTLPQIPLTAPNPQNSATAEPSPTQTLPLKPPPSEAPQQEHKESQDQNIKEETIKKSELKKDLVVEIQREQLLEWDKRKGESGEECLSGVVEKRKERDLERDGLQGGDCGNEENEHEKLENIEKDTKKRIKKEVFKKSQNTLQSPQNAPILTSTSNAPDAPEAPEAPDAPNSPPSNPCQNSSPFHSSPPFSTVISPSQLPLDQIDIPFLEPKSPCNSGSSRSVSPSPRHRYHRYKDTSPAPLPRNTLTLISYLESEPKAPLHKLLGSKAPFSKYDPQVEAKLNTMNKNFTNQIGRTEAELRRLKKISETELTQKSLEDLRRKVKRVSKKICVEKVEEVIQLVQERKNNQWVKRDKERELKELDSHEDELRMRLRGVYVDMETSEMRKRIFEFGLKMEGDRGEVAKELLKKQEDC